MIFNNLRCAVCVLLVVGSTSLAAERRAKVKYLVLPEPAIWQIDIDFGNLTPLPASIELAEMHIRFVDEEGTDVLGSVTRQLSAGGGRLAVQKDAKSLTPGNYYIVTVLFDQNGQQIGAPYRHSIDWPGQAEAFRGVRILNNMVWELLRVEAKEVHGSESLHFKSPKRRWAYVTATLRDSGGPLRVTLGNHVDIIAFADGETGTREAMRYLPAGEYELTVDSDGPCHIDSLVVRSIPEILLHEFMGGPYGKLDVSLPEYFARYINPHVNTFVVAPNRLADGHVDLSLLHDWKRRGGRVLAAAPALGTPDVGGPSFSFDQVAEYLANSPGLSNPLADGIILDEFVGHNDISYSHYGRVIRQVKQDPSYVGKHCYIYASTIFGITHGRTLIDSIFESDSVMAWERYIPTAQKNYLPEPGDTATRNFLRTEYGLVDGARGYRDHHPDAIEHMAVCFGSFSTPGGEMLNTTPRVNHKVFLDMQFNIVANEPTFWGTYGLMGYHTSYTDDETLRWICQLFRHYGIEGNTVPATDDPYVSPHLTDGDFKKGTEGWELAAAEAGSIRTDSKPGLANLQGRYGRRVDGDTGLVTRRSASKPNTIRRTIGNLEPGRLYTFRMLTCDFEDMSKRELHAVSYTLENTTSIPEKSFSAIIPSLSFVYIDKHKTWSNYHWHLFRANAETATLTITDWKSDSEPGGPVDQQLLLNFIQVHPYFE